MNLTLIAQKIGVPVKEWPGNCYGIASLFLTHRIVPKGRLCYGIWLGPIHPKSIFHGRPFTHHGWIEDNRTVVDPTRFAFENKKPYVYLGPNNGEYDFGGNILKERYLKPCPEFDSSQRTFSFSKLSFDAKAVIFTFTSALREEISFGQMFWLANCPLQLLGEDAAKELYEWINSNARGLIPLDNLQYVLG